MSLSLFPGLDRNLSLNNSNNFIDNFINELRSYLERSSSSMYTLDRFEGDFAVLEDRNTKKMIDVPSSKLPSNAREGDILNFSNGSYTIDHEETKAVSDRIRQKMNNLKKHN